MSDGLFVIACVFALALLYSATRIAIAMIGRRGEAANPPLELERQVAMLTAQVAELQHAADVTERELGRLAEGQRFTDRLIASRHDAPAVGSATGLRHPDHDPPSNVR